MTYKAGRQSEDQQQKEDIESEIRFLKKNHTRKQSICTKTTEHEKSRKSLTVGNNTGDKSMANVLFHIKENNHCKQIILNLFSLFLIKNNDTYLMKIPGQILPK